MAKETNEQVLENFFHHNDVLIVDKNPRSRTRLMKTMIDLGTKHNQIHTAASIGEVVEVIKGRKIGLVLSEYFIGGGSGFDLFKIVRERDKKNQDLCLVLVTSNVSQTAVAKAAEEEVDSFILKPYTIQSIKDSLVDTIISKINPSDYIKKVNEAKDLIAKGDFDLAKEMLLQAKNMHPKPALALFYIGQIEHLKELLNQAKGNFKKGLTFNNIHFKCLIGLYEVFIREQQLYDAYDVVKKVAKFFPANPDRLTQVVRLAVQTANFKDMQFYYEVFTTLDERTDVLINYIGAGLYISGKYCLMKNDFETAIQFFDNIAVSCSQSTKFLRAMITVLIEYNRGPDAEKYLSRFSSDERESEDYLVSDFLINTQIFKEQPGFILKKGLELYNKDIRDFHCMRALIEAMKLGGFNEDKIQVYEQEILKLWPEKFPAETIAS